MDRREFLKLFAFAGATLALPAAILIGDEEDEGWIATPPRPYDGLPYVMAFTAQGHGDESRATLVGLKRVGQEQPLLQYYLNELGGLLSWQSRLGEEILVPDFAPVEIFSNSTKTTAYACLRLPGLERYQVLSACGSSRESCAIG